MKRIVLCIFAIMSISMAMAQQVSHTVQRGETLESIAHKYNITVEKLKQANPDASEMFYVGMKLNVPQVQEIQGNAISTQNQTEYSPQQETTIQEPKTIQENPQEIDRSTHEGIYFDSSYSDFELGVMTDNEFSFNTFSLSLGGVIDGISLRLISNLKSQKSDNVRSSTSYMIAAGYNARIRFSDYVFVDFRPSAYYAHSSQEVATGTELRESKKGSYYNVKTWETKKSDSYGLLLEPRIALQYKSFYLCLGYEWEFNKFKLKKEYKSEAVYLGVGWTFK